MIEQVFEMLLFLSEMCNFIRNDWADLKLSELIIFWFAIKIILKCLMIVSSKDAL